MNKCSPNARSPIPLFPAVVEDQVRFGESERAAKQAPPQTSAARARKVPREERKGACLPEKCVRRYFSNSLPFCIGACLRDSP